MQRTQPAAFCLSALETVCTYYTSGMYALARALSLCSALCMLAGHWLLWACASILAYWPASTDLLLPMPCLSCSAKCLKNRHGEDCAAADASEAWWCPCCRGSCGAGCVGCCNCGFCRKKVSAGQAPLAVLAVRAHTYMQQHGLYVHFLEADVGRAR